MPKGQDFGGKKKKSDIPKGFSSELDHERMQPTTDDLFLNKLYTAHSGDFVLLK